MEGEDILSVLNIGTWELAVVTGKGHDPFVPRTSNV